MKSGSKGGGIQGGVSPLLLWCSAVLIHPCLSHCHPIRSGKLQKCCRPLCSFSYRYPSLALAPWVNPDDRLALPYYLHIGGGVHALNCTVWLVWSYEGQVNGTKSGAHLHDPFFASCLTLWVALGL